MRDNWTVDWKWDKRMGIEGGDDVHLALLRNHAVASTSALAHLEHQVPKPYALENTSHPLMSSSESLLDQEVHIWNETAHYRAPSKISRYHKGQLFGILLRVPVRLAKYLQLQVRYRLGVTIATPGMPSFRIPRQLLWRPTRQLMYAVWCLSALLFILLLLLSAILLYGGVPPSYAAVRAAEYALPQHHWGSNRWKKTGWRGRNVGDLALGDGEEHYLRFPDHLWGHGLNNVLQEAILTSHLTLSVDRTPVFEDYTWSHLPVQYTVYDFSLRPTRIPLGAFVGGVLGGQEPARYDTDDLSEQRRAVSAAYFDYVCPPNDVVEVVYRWPEQSSNHTVGEIKSEERVEEGTGDTDSGSIVEVSAQKSAADYMPFPSPDADGTQIMKWFTKRLSEPDVRDKRCVMIREERRVFDSNFFGSNKILPLLPDLLTSPILTKFEWSKLVRGAIDKNVQRFLESSSSLSETDTARFIPKPTGANHTLPGVLALHLRRGDYKRHCMRLKGWASGYMGILDILSDHFDPENGWSGELLPSDLGAETEEKREEMREAYYLQHCLPDVQQIVARLRGVRNEYDLSWYQNIQKNSNEANESERRTRSESDSHDEESQIPLGQHKLRHVYVLTNGWPSFLEELRLGLLEDGWESVVGTPNWENTAPALSFQLMDESGHAKYLNKEERGVSAAIDMGIAQRSEVFVGNGFSSLSSNVIMMRLANGFPLYTNRLL